MHVTRIRIGRHELWRRLRLDPGRALDELRPRLEAKDHAVSTAVASLLAPHMTKDMKPAEQRAVLAAEPRWAAFRKGVW